MAKKKKRSGYLFVYGTLKKGHWNYNAYLADLAVSIRKAEYHGAKLYDLGEFPALKLNCLGKVVGEIVEVDDIDEALYRCDILEGYNQKGKNNAYNRVEIEVEGTMVWTYEFNLWHLLKDIDLPTMEEWNDPYKEEVHHG